MVGDSYKSDPSGRFLRPSSKRSRCRSTPTAQGKEHVRVVAAAREMMKFRKSPGLSPMQAQQFTLKHIRFQYIQHVLGQVPSCGRGVCFNRDLKGGGDTQRPWPVHTLQESGLSQRANGNPLGCDSYSSESQRSGPSRRCSPRSQAAVHLLHAPGSWPPIPQCARASACTALQTREGLRWVQMQPN